MKDGLIKDQTVADLLIAGFEANGIDIVFGVPGEETTALMAAIDRSGMTFVLCRHEQSAAFMASVHGRLTGKPALCLATLGPGAANLMTGVADANLDHVPLIAVTGQGARARLERESHQAVDLAALFAPVTKSSRCLQVPDEVSQAAAEAARLAVAEKPGAVHLSLPEDLAALPCAAEPVMAPPPPMMRALPDDLERAVAVLDRAQHPLILVGAGVIRAGAAQAARALAERLMAPMLTTFMAKGVLPPDHALNLFTLGQPQDDVADAALEQADLILALGFDPVEYPPAKVTGDGACPVIDIAATAPEAAPDWPVQGNAGW